jgi:hypothetical protein
MARRTGRVPREIQDNSERRRTAEESPLSTIRLISELLAENGLLDFNDLNIMRSVDAPWSPPIPHIPIALARLGWR